MHSTTQARRIGQEVCQTSLVLRVCDGLCTWVGPLGVDSTDIGALVGNLETSIQGVVGSSGVVIDGEVELPDTCK